MITIRLAKRGRKHLPIYDIVVANVRSPRDGRFIEKLGTYSPVYSPTQVTLKENLIRKWLNDGAKMTTTVRSILSNSGLLTKFHFEKGLRIEGITQDTVDKKYKDWLKIHSKKQSNFVFNIQ